MLGTCWNCLLSSIVGGQSRNSRFAEAYSFLQSAPLRLQNCPCGCKRAFLTKTTKLLNNLQKTASRFAAGCRYSWLQTTRLRHFEAITFPPAKTGGSRLAATKPTRQPLPRPNCFALSQRQKFAAAKQPTRGFDAKDQSLWRLQICCMPIILQLQNREAVLSAQS